ncbi:MAG: 4Fe-4S dicluster domain-containing protein [Rhodospirillaceae bacterium]
MSEREAMEFDVVIVGGGPSGLAAAIRIRRQAEARGEDISVCVLEKGSEVGAHILSGAVMETRALDELLPDWRERNAPLVTETGSADSFWYLTPPNHIPLPVPPQMHNKGNYIVSLGNVARWLGEQAEALGVEIYAGFAAAEVLYDETTGAVRGVATGDMGIGKDGQPTENHEPGVELHAKITMFAEGCRGSLTKTVMERFDLNKDAQPQTYGIGIKELWEVDPAVHQPGRVIHTVGWPLPSDTYGGSFMYHMEDNMVAVGFVVGLDYSNPYLSPYEEFQRFKTHPSIKPFFEGGRRVAYGARALAEGGYQSLPKLTFPGGVLIGDTAGFLNVPKIKGTHTAMKSGMLAADAVVDHLIDAGDGEGAGAGAELTAYPEALKDSWVYRELKKVRNVRPAFKWGLYAGIAYSALDTFLFRGMAPWTFSHHHDHEALKKARDSRPIAYPKPDGVITFDRLTSVSLSNTYHEENQPVHLTLKDGTVPVSTNLSEYDGPEARYCPAGVYEFIEDPESEAGRKLQINASNCVHCKTCDIKDPTQNINWVVPEGGGGPNYPNM